MVAIRQTVTSAGTGNRTLSVAAGTAIGDVLIAFVGSSFGGNITGTNPTGSNWILLATEGAWWFPPRAAIWRKPVTVAGAASYTFAITGSNDHQVVLFVVQAAGASMDADARMGVWTRHHRAPAVDAPTTSDLLLCASIVAGLASYTPPDEMTERSDNYLTNWSTMTSASQALTARGSTGRKTFYSTNPSMHATMSCVVRDSTPTNVPIGQAVEMELGGPLSVIGPFVAIPIGQAVETETARPVRDYREVAYNALIAALADPDRKFTATVEVDWDGDGTWDHAVSNLSSVSNSVSIDRDLTGTLPDDVTVIEGYISGQLVVDFNGSHEDYPDLNSAELFAPHNTLSPLYNAKRTGVRVRCSIVTTTDAGPIPLPQFTGRVRGISVSSADRTARITCTDWVEDMRTEVDLPVVGSAAGHVFNPTWALDWLLRRAQLYASPPPRTDAIMVATLNGAWWPEVGYFDDEFNGIHISLGPPWVPARYSYGANAASGARAYQDYHANGKYSPRASTAVAAGFWVNWSATIGPTWVECFFSDTADTTRFCRIAIDGTGVVTGILAGPSSYAKIWTGSTITTSGWHYIGLHIAFSSGGVPTGRICVDGVVTSHGTGATYSMALAVPTFHNQVRLDIQAQVSSVQVWLPTTTDFTFPMTVDAVSTNLELAVQQLRTLPDRKGVQALEVFKEIAQADLGAVGADENGVVYFLRRSTIQESFIGVEWDLGPDVRKDLTSSDSLDQVRNVVNGQVAPTTVFRGDAYPPNNVVYTQPTAALLQTAPGVTRVAKVPFDDGGAAWVQEGNVPWTDPFDKDVVQHGFAVRDVANTLTPPSVTVSVRRFDYRTLEVTIVNGSIYTIELKDSTGASAFHVQGSHIHRYERPQVDTDPAFDFAYEYEPSITAYGRRLYTIPDNEWRQDWTDSVNLSLSLLSDTVEPIPVIDMMPVFGHPLRRLGDTVTIDDPGGLGGPFTGVLVGVKRSLSVDGGLSDSLTPQLLAPPGTG